MGYRLLYGKQILFDPYTDDYVTDAQLTSSVNAASYFDFTISISHSLYDTVAEHAGLIELYFDKIKLFSGEISKIDIDIEGNKSISCTGAMDYLSDSLVRPYSTVEGEADLVAPSSVDGYFQWLIDQHNKHCKDSRKQFSVGVNQGNMLDANNYIYRKSDQHPTTASEIEDKILDSLGGYLFIRYQDDMNVLDLYADAHEANTKIIDFGTNITNFTKTTSTDDQYTAVVATGYTPDPPEDDPKKEMKPIGLDGCVDGGTPYSSTIVKMGDVVYDIAAVSRYGYKEYYASNNDITTYDGLLQYACKVLNTLLSPSLSITVNAVDLALYMDNGYEHMQIGQAVRVRSKLHKVDEYLMVNSITLDLNDPGNTEYQLGVSYDTLTGQQSSYLKSLNAGINSSLDSVASLDKTVKDSAKEIKAVGEKAEQAKTDAYVAGTKADEANAKANTATDTANNANTKADEAKADAANASLKSDEANTKADAATETANNASSKADTAINNSKDAADKAAAASQKADANTAKITTVENTIKTISGDTATAIANAKAAKDAADAAKQAADQAQSDASTANTEIGKVQSQVGTINTEISNIKQEATDLRDDLSGQITTVKNTMESDYTRKTELSETTATLRNEISQSAAGVIQTVSQDYATKSELKTTTDATNKNAADLTNAINKFNSDVDNLQGQIDGAINTWFYEVDPTDKNEPAVNWNTDDLKKVHLGDLYYNTVSGYCWRYQLQNGSYSWSRITDVDVTKALADSAAAQTTANSKKRIFVTTPNPPYDVGDLWTQGTAGDIMRCQTAKTSSQSYSAADWIKASKYTDDTAVTKLSNTVEKTYSTKTEVKQLSDQVSSTVSSLETVRISADAAQTSANNAKKAADDAQTAADAAKANAATAQSKADEAAKNLATAEQNLKTLQSQANATDEQLTAAKAEVEKAKTAAATAQSTANTAKNNASTAQATADTAKANAKTAQDAVDALKNRVTSAETSIKQNSDAIALRATKTEVTSAINSISIGGRNLLRGSNIVASESSTYIKDKYGWYGNYKTSSIKAIEDNGETVIEVKRSGTPTDGFLPSVFTQWVLLEWDKEYRASIDIKLSADFQASSSTPFHFHIKASDSSDPFDNRSLTDITTATITLSPSGAYLKANTWYHFTYTIKTPAKTPDSTKPYCKFRLFVYGKNKGSIVTYNTSWLKNCKLEKGNKPTDWTPAPEDIAAESKTYTDAQIKISADSIKSEVSSVKNTADSALTKATSVEQTATGLTTKVTAAQSTADTAKANAATAQATANTANSNAATAQATADTAKANAATAQSTANTANSTANDAKTATNILETLIRQSGDGVEVAKKVNGEYTSTKTLMGSDGFYVEDENGDKLTQILSNKVVLGKENTTHVHITPEAFSFVDNKETAIARFYDGGMNVNRSSFNLHTSNASDGMTYNYIDTKGDFWIQSKIDTTKYPSIPSINRSTIHSNTIYSETDEDIKSQLSLSSCAYINPNSNDNAPVANIRLSSYDTSANNTSAHSLIALSATAIRINNKSLEDFVIAQGTSGYWMYRIWKSGFKEAWTEIGSNTGPNTGSDYTMTIPWTSYKGRYCVYITKSTVGSGTVNNFNDVDFMVYSQTKTSFKIATWNRSSVNVPLNLDIYVVDRLVY